MYHDTTYEVRKKNRDLFTFCEDITEKSKNMYNVTNYHIRNVMTGIKKDESEITPNEKEVLDTVFATIPKVNEIIRRTNERKGDKEKHQKEIELPTKEKWMLSYKTLDGIFKLTDNEDYRAMPINVSQNSIKECVESWKGYFSLLREYKKNPSKFNGKPRIPRYKKNLRMTAVIGNQLAYIKDGTLHLPEKNTLDISGYVPQGKLIEVRISPCYNGYVINVITDDGIEEPKMSKATGTMMVDPGLNNFVAVTDNRGGVPFIVKGGFLKSRNQYFNKKRAEITSQLMKGKNPKKCKPVQTKRLNTLSEKRNRFFDDCFYKISHRIAREATERNCGKVVIGKNVGQKQNINIGHVNNQNFVMIPFARFVSILKIVCMKYGIEVIEQEESYTSKASALDKDRIPDYQDDTKHKFSGKRIKRGLYRSKDGTEFNADINGSMNIGRKHNTWVFSKVKSFDNMINEINVLNFGDFYKSSPGKAG